MTIRLTLCAGLLCLALSGAVAGILSPVGTTNTVISHDGSVASIPGMVPHAFAVAYPNIDNQPPPVSNDTYVDKQWALARIHIPAGWTIKPRNEVVVAVLDTGIDINHEDLAGKVIGSINLSASATSEDIYGHGTHIAGIIAARTNNDKGIAGVDQNIKLLNVKVVDDNGDINGAIVADGVIWAADHGADVINLSVVITEPSARLEGAIDYAWSKGAIIIAAAGNGIEPAKVYPALYQNVIAVMAANENDQVSAGLLGKEAIVAPGYNIFSTLPGNRYGYKSGSSMATAYVSAEAALAFSAAHTGRVNLNRLVSDQIWRATDRVESSALNFRYINFEKLAAAIQQ
jgi:thermitase